MSAVVREKGGGINTGISTGEGLRSDGPARDVDRISSYPTGATGILRRSIW